MQSVQSLIQAYKQRWGLSYRELGALWGLKPQYLRRLGHGGLTTIGPKSALLIERGSRGEIKAADLVLAGRKPAASKRRRAC